MATLCEAVKPVPQDLLCDADLARLAAMRAPRRASQFLAGRALARMALQDACGSAARAWQVRTDARGAPYVSGEPGLYLSLSHSGNLVGCAVGDVPLGLDLEAPRVSRDWAALLEATTTRPERDGLPEAESEALALTVWTLKEAWLKATSGELFETMLGDGARVMPSDSSQANGRVWTVGATAAALVVPGGLPAVRGDVPAPVEGSYWLVGSG